jgi:replicative DNA helicase
MSDTEAEGEGFSLDEWIEYGSNLPPDLQRLGLVKMAQGAPADATLGQMLPDAEQVLTPEQVEVFRLLVEHRAPGRAGVVAAELMRLHDRALAAHLYEELRRPTNTTARMVDGGSFILDLPDNVPSIWGEGNRVVWADGEALMLVGPPGVGKTTLAGQLVRSRLVGGSVLGMPVEATSSQVLYLAMDRPKQIARALARTLGSHDRETLSERLTFWEGPPEADIAVKPELLLELAQGAGADTVVVDSLKDAAVGLSTDDGAGGYNRARQLCLANGVQVLELHHMVKRGEGGNKPTTLADLYGSIWIAAGAGSVVLLSGDPGDPVVQWKHLKQPAEEVGPIYVQHDHAAGTSSIYGGVDLVAVARRAGGEGITAKAYAELIYETTKPTKAQIEKARRALNREVGAGRLDRRDGDAGSKTPTTWVAADLPPAELDEMLSDIL